MWLQGQCSANPSPPAAILCCLGGLEVWGDHASPTQTRPLQPHLSGPMSQPPGHCPFHAWAWSALFPGHLLLRPSLITHPSGAERGHLLLSSQGALFLLLLWPFWGHRPFTYMVVIEVKQATRPRPASLLCSPGGGVWPVKLQSWI